MRNIALEIPLRTFPFGRGRQGHDAYNARIQAFGNAFDRTAFSRCIPPFKDRHNLQALVLYPFLQLDKFNLQATQFLFIKLFV